MTNSDTEQQKREQQNPAPPPNWRQVIGSVMAAAFGVQSKQNRERDFEHGKPIIFIAAGIIFTILFVVAMIAIVSTVVKTAG